MGEGRPSAFGARCDPDWMCPCRESSRIPGRDLPEVVLGAGGVGARGSGGLGEGTFGMGGQHQADFSQGDEVCAWLPGLLMLPQPR